MSGRIPLVDYLVLDDHPHLVANECARCGARFFDRRNACASCSGTGFDKVAIATVGEVTAFTVWRTRRPMLQCPSSRRWSTATAPACELTWSTSSPTLST
jgi:uncharacterized protein